MDIREFKSLTDPVFLATLRLQSDDYWHKMNSDERRYYTEESVRIGDDLAEDFLNDFPASDVQSIAEQCMIRVRKDEQPLVTETPDYLADWFSARKRISIHAGIAHHLIRLLASYQVEVSEEEAIRLLFLRAFFSYYSEEKEQLPSRVLEPFTGKVLFSKREFPILSADKAAADRFTDRIADFPVPVGLLPYLQLVQTGRTDIATIRNLVEKGRIK